MCVCMLFIDFNIVFYVAIIIIIHTYIVNNTAALSLY